MTNLSEDGWRVDQFDVYSNGSYVRFDNGHLLGRATPRDGKIIRLMGGDSDGVFFGQVDDTLLVERIKKYWNEYYGIRWTNCSSFAHFLTTGNFAECEKNLGLLVIEQGMRPYEMASRVDVGDMVCLLYANEQKTKSRKDESSTRYRRVLKQRHDSGTFRCAAAMQLQSRSFSPEEIRGIYHSSQMDDFHFMVCVAKWRGEPIWLSQMGYARPGEKDVAYFALTRGEKDSYPFEAPALVFIKKRRSKKAAN